MRTESCKRLRWYSPTPPSLASIIIKTLIMMCCSVEVKEQSPFHLSHHRCFAGGRGSAAIAAKKAPSESEMLVAAREERKM